MAASLGDREMPEATAAEQAAAIAEAIRESFAQRRSFVAAMKAIMEIHGVSPRLAKKLVAMHPLWRHAYDRSQSAFDEIVDQLRRDGATVRRCDGIRMRSARSS